MGESLACFVKTLSDYCYTLQLENHLLVCFSGLSHDSQRTVSLHQDQPEVCLQKVCKSQRYVQGDSFLRFRGIQLDKSPYTLDVPAK